MNRILTLSEIVKETENLYKKHFPENSPLPKEDALKLAHYLVGRPAK